MTTKAAQLKAMLEYCISNSLKPVILSDAPPIESYLNIYSFSGCAMYISVDPNTAFAYGSDYGLTIIPYEYMYGLQLKDSDKQLDLSAYNSVSSSIVCSDDIRTILRKMADFSFTDYIMSLNFNNWIQSIISEDFNNNNILKLKCNVNKTHLIPPKIEQSFIYSTYDKVSCIKLPLRYAHMILKGHIPTEVYNYSYGIYTDNVALNENSQYVLNKKVYTDGGT